MKKNPPEKIQFKPYDVREKLWTLLTDLKKMAAKGKTPTPTGMHRGEWNGADIIVTSAPPPHSNQWPCGHRTRVQTRHALALTWLFFEIRNIFRGFLTFENKYEFFERLAKRANNFLAWNQPEPKEWHPMLKVVLWEAITIVDEIVDDPLWNRQYAVTLTWRDIKGETIRIPLL